ncbi:major facilitator superfamily MFS_1 [Thiorhodococcus drewsii AZ1]|uniref:Major facilitator superfamily MFS_1 n=1 Tax=Thiorhodococcus drewsii AZ1 TaxID=765913 RepID=G2DXR5_9GAMM|nr:major facilitator superfamily MFS_1 [Thiorhodococcus drewsii AZ1]
MRSFDVKKQRPSAVKSSDTPNLEIPKTPLSPTERRAAMGLAAIFSTRMLGLFMVLPVFALYADDLPGATPLLIGLAIGAYGLTQAILQIPLGLLSDRIGRKPVIYGGLALFALGSLVAALADSIQWVILGRALQGSGAIAAAIIALTADLTRDEVRTKGMAAIGISVALSFAAALVIGPPIARWIGISGIFALTSVLAIVGMLILAYVVPDPDRSMVHRDAQPVLDQLSGVLRNPTLLRLDLSIFMLHLTMVSMFVVLPLSVESAGLAPVDHWMIYLPAVLLAILAMVPFIVMAERLGKVKPVLLGAVIALGATMFGFYLFHWSLWLAAFLLVVVFTIFNLLEAVLPSLVSKAARAGAKGTAMGVFSSSQFVGAFLGGLLGGWAHGSFGPQAVYLVGAMTSLAWIGVVATMRIPANLTRHILTLGILPEDAVPDVEQRLLDVPGVEEAVIARDEGVAYLKVDSRQLDWARLQAFSASA